MDLRDQLQSTLGAAYTLDRELGGGGMSRVFVATETSLARQVVVKVLPPETAGQISVERFRREITLAAQLQHPHIVPLLAAGVAGDVLYFTMPYIRGESLRTRVARHGELPVQDAVRILREVASALAFAHAAGVIHRDIKPDNVLISGDAAMVTDFGVAKALSESTAAGDASGLTSLGVALGTPAYMSPEQVSADPLVDHRADIYSWGILAYELLSGATPFHGRPPQAMLAAHVQEQPEPLDRRRPSLQPALSALVARCLSKRPADRPQSAQELVSALDAVATTPSGGGLAPFGGAHTGAGTAARRSVRTAMIAAGVVTIAVAGYAAIAMIRSRGRAPRSLAVLPCVSRDTAFQFFAEAVSDEVRTALTRIPGLSVQGKSTSSAFVGAETSARLVGDSLHVGAVFECSVTRAGARMHMTAELLNAATGAAIWSQTTDHDVKDLAVVQDSLTTAIASALQVAVGGARAVNRRQVDPDVRDLVLRAEYLISRGTERDLREAITSAQAAVARDSLFANAYAILGGAYVPLADQYVSPAEAYPRAKAYAQRALAMDSSSVNAYFAIAAATAWFDWDFPAANRLFDRAFTLAPRDAFGRAARGLVLCWQGRIADGIAHTDTASVQDPLAIFASWDREFCLYQGGRYREAIEQRRRTREINPAFVYLDSFDGAAYRELGMLDSAMIAYKRDVVLNGGVPLYGLAITHARAGRKDEARKVIAAIEAFQRDHYYPVEFIAVAYANIGELDRAFDWLGRVFQTRSAMWIGFSQGPEWEPLRRDPRWAAIRQRAGLQ